MAYFDKTRRILTVSDVFCHFKSCSAVLKVISARKEREWEFRILEYRVTNSEIRISLSKLKGPSSKLKGQCREIKAPGSKITYHQCRLSGAEDAGVVAEFGPDYLGPIGGFVESPLTNLGPDVIDKGIPAGSGAPADYYHFRI